MKRKYKYLICDSVKAYDYFKKKIHHDQLLSASPALLMHKDIKCKSLYKVWSVKKLKEFQTTIFDLNKKIFLNLNKIKKIRFEENIVTNIAINNFQKNIFKISSISNIKLNDSCLLIKHKSENKSYKYSDNCWENYLKNHKKIHILEFTDKKNSSNSGFRFFLNINFFQRVFFAGLETVNLRLFKKINFIHKFFVKKKYLIHINENELLLEAAGHFMQKGYKILNLIDALKDSKNIKKEAKEKQINEIYKLCLPLIEKRIKIWTNKNYHDIALELFKEILKDKLNNFYYWEKKTKNFFLQNNQLNEKNTILFCNAPANEKCLAIKSIFNEYNVPLVAFQHGVSAEISNSHRYNRIFHDTTASDIFVAFNQQSAFIKNDNPFSKSKTIKYKGSKRFSRVDSLMFNHVKNNSVLYLSNNLYKGNFGSLATWTNDEFMAKNEIKIISSVLCKINAQVFYKPYPEINHRYFDQDPAINLIQKSTKLAIIENNVDARYIVSNYEIVICGSATSTLSWALMSNRPLVFINYKNHASLKNIAYNSLKKSVFLFDFDDKMFAKNIISFLNLPIEKINELWKKKLIARKSFIKDFISDYTENRDLFSLINTEVDSFHNDRKRNKS